MTMKHSQLQQPFDALQEENFRCVTFCLNVPQQLHYGCKSLNDCVHFHLLGWRLLRMTTGSTLKSWRSN